MARDAQSRGCCSVEWKDSLTECHSQAGEAEGGGGKDDALAFFFPLLRQQSRSHQM